MLTISDIVFGIARNIDPKLPSPTTPPCPISNLAALDIMHDFTRKLELGERNPRMG